MLRTCQFLTILTSESLSRAGVVQILSTSWAADPLHHLAFRTYLCEPSQPQNYGKTQQFAQFLPAKISHASHLRCKTSFPSNIDVARPTGNFQYNRKLELLNLLWQDICLFFLYTSYLKILSRNHASDLYFSVHQYESSISYTSSDSCLSIFVSQAPLRAPCLWIHVSASLCISGSSARSKFPDPDLNIHIYLRILCKIHVSGLVSKHPCVSQCKIPPYLRIHVSEPCLNSHLSGSGP